jgi:hypothetical protein
MPASSSATIAFYLKEVAAEEAEERRRAEEAPEHARRERAGRRHKVELVVSVSGFSGRHLLCLHA